MRRIRCGFCPSCDPGSSPTGGQCPAFEAASGADRPGGGSRHDLIRLRCTRDELDGMEPFVEVHYVDKRGSDYGGPHFGADPNAFEATYASYEVKTVAVEEERIPAGELAFHRGADLEATDGRIGKVSEFLIDPSSEHITHLVLLEGHLWGRNEVTLPVSAIARIATDTVYLKLDKAAVEELPVVPVKRC